MKVPQNIKDAIKKCAKYNALAYENECIIINWLEKHKLTEDTCTDDDYNMTDSFIDCCLYGNNRADEFIDDLEHVDK